MYLTNWTWRARYLSSSKFRMSITYVLAMTKKHNQVDHGSLPDPNTPLGRGFLLYGNYLRSREWEEQVFSRPIIGCMVRVWLYLCDTYSRQCPTEQWKRTTFEALTEMGPSFRFYTTTKRRALHTWQLSASRKYLCKICIWRVVYWYNLVRATRKIMEELGTS